METNAYLFAALQTMQLDMGTFFVDMAKRVPITAKDIYREYFAKLTYEREMTERNADFLMGDQ